MSFSFKVLSKLEADALLDGELQEGFSLCRLARRMPDGQVFAQIFQANMQDRAMAAHIIRCVKLGVRQRTDAEWVAGRDMVAEQDRA